MRRCPRTWSGTPSRSSLAGSPASGMAVSADDERFLEAALAEARAAQDDGEVPVGAVVVLRGRVIGRGRNRVEATQDPTAHAEIIAIGAASQTLKSWRLDEATLY